MTIDLKTLKAMSDGAMIMAAQAEQMAIFAAGMVEGARQMAESMQSIVNDCARQLAERRATENAAENNGAAAAAQAACESAAQETTANVSSLKSPSLPQNAASGAFQPESGQTGRSDAESRPAPLQGATGASTAPQTPAAEQTAPQTPPLDLVTLRAFVAERSTPENRAKIKAILTRYGVRKLTELKESQYEAVRNEVAAL
ncbi:MAG: hypothetical protein ACI4MG_09155 [Aristaeellaceae bacterium]